MRPQDRFSLFIAQLFQREFVVDYRDNKITRLYLCTALHDCDITVQNPSIFHRIPFDGYEHRARRFTNQFLVDANYVAARIADCGGLTRGYFLSCYRSSETFETLGGSIIAQESFLQGATDVRAQIGRIAVTKPDGIFLPGYLPEMAATLKQMKEMAVTIPILSVQAFDDPEILARVGDAAEGVIFSVPKPPDSKDPVVANFRSNYAARYGREPGVCSDTGYDALRIVAAVLEQGASAGPEIQQALARLKDFPGAAGVTTI